jgi:hypothetical protein
MPDIGMPDFDESAATLLKQRLLRFFEILE